MTWAVAVAYDDQELQRFPFGSEQNARDFYEKCQKRKDVNVAALRHNGVTQAAYCRHLEKAKP